ncbi:MAG: SUMF1/EgtB/PvdO family nonheme iron enzyme [Armatimonadetes bacterium]|nr:SUMF1/EgtB/PvdO family nonheme iron enzyme [Armatimonadota bacterium]
MLPTPTAPPPRAATVRMAYAPGLWVADGGDARRAEPGSDAPGLEIRWGSVRYPLPGQDRTAWLSAMEAMRRMARSQPLTDIAVTYTGTRAWVRLQPDAARKLALKPGEAVTLTADVTPLAGNGRLCLAFDYLDGRSGAWVGWSTVRASAQAGAPGKRSRVRLATAVPELPAGAFAVPIVGQDGTFEAAPGRWTLHSVEMETPGPAGRVRAPAGAGSRAAKLDRSIYGRRDLDWGAGNLTCAFAFLYDAALCDPESGKLTADAWLDDLERRVGHVDSLVLWHAYPRIGVDDRNQFDFYRDLPGGLRGLRELTRRMRARGTRCFIDYNPWDTGTRRETVADTEALAGLVHEIEADGIFLDTMVAAPTGLRAAIDAGRPGVIFEPEGAPPLEQTSLCSSSWAQWGPVYDEPSVLLLKWVEPRHMQHRIQRWSRTHQSEIDEAWLNGSGMMVWENVFGSWVPWNAEDCAVWKRASGILRAFAPELASDRWEPAVPTLRAGAFASRWRSDGLELTLILDRSGAGGPLVRTSVRRAGAQAWDLWTGRELAIGPDGGIRVEPNRYAAIAVAWTRASKERVRRLAADAPPSDAPTATEPEDALLRRLAGAMAPRPPQVCEPLPAGAPLPDGMVRVDAGRARMRLRHERRECGCYADPGMPAERLAGFLVGLPFNETVTHDFTVEVPAFAVDEALVTNGQYAAFIKATGYRPACADNFLRHWGGDTFPAGAEDLPVVYVDLNDARAYARWAGKRLPTEAEWQRAAQGETGRAWPWGDAFDATRCAGPHPEPVRTHPDGRSVWGCYDMAGNVWQLTESERSDGHTRSCILRGGSGFDAPGSGWYVHGGPQRLDSHTRFLLMHPGLDRSATIGFRCVRALAPVAVAP